MKPVTVLGIYREQAFSPGKVGDDAAILDTTLAELAGMGATGEAVSADTVNLAGLRCDYVLNMAQSDRVLDMLGKWSMQGTRVFNSVQSIRSCYRKPLLRALQKSGIPMPPGYIASLRQAESRIPRHLPGRLWLKRGDVHAMEDGDVSSVASEAELTEALGYFRLRRIREILVQEHVAGHVIKFYAVGQDEYFRAFLADTGEDVTSEMAALHLIATKAARSVGLEIYGGDAILTPKGKVMLIDLNDWPSFSRCCKSAARSIAQYVMGVIDFGEFPMAGASVGFSDGTFLK